MADNLYPFAVCFVCHQKGHLASACKDNVKGLYPSKSNDLMADGGGCKYCGSVKHLARDCKPTQHHVSGKKNLFDKIDNS